MTAAGSCSTAPRAIRAMRTTTTRAPHGAAARACRCTTTGPPCGAHTWRGAGGGGRPRTQRRRLACAVAGLRKDLQRQHAISLERAGRVTEGARAWPALRQRRPVSRDHRLRGDAGIDQHMLAGDAVAVIAGEKERRSRNMARVEADLQAL